MTSELKLAHFGYVCAPYLHTHTSTELSESWINSPNIEELFFATSTFSKESKPYFSDSTNHYLLAKFKDSLQISSYLKEHNQDRTSFVFNVGEDLFHRDVEGDTGFISVYYLECGMDYDDLQDIANILLKMEKITVAAFGSMEIFCLIPSKFTFPYSENMVVVEVASEKSHQSLKKYCEQIRRDANRKGVLMTNMMSLSILEQLK